MYRVVDLTNLNWATTHSGGVSYGAFYKTSETVNITKYYYKCSNFYSGQQEFGDESIYEVICSRLLNKLGLNCINCALVLAKIKINNNIYTTYVSKSENYFKEYNSRTTLENLVDILRTKDNNIDVIINKLGISKQIKEIIIADFITIQRDRHGENIELLEKDNKYTVAPMFDNGLSFLAPYPSKITNLNQIVNFEVMNDYPVNNYIGQRSLFGNLKYINKPIPINKLKPEDRRSIFYNLANTLPKEYLDKIWEIILTRYDFLLQGGYVYVT